jgi:hypothetical protein
MSSEHTQLFKGAQDSGFFRVADSSSASPFKSLVREESPLVSSQRAFASRTLASGLRGSTGPPNRLLRRVLLPIYGQAQALDFAASTRAQATLASLHYGLAPWRLAPGYSRLVTLASLRFASLWTLASLWGRGDGNSLRSPACKHSEEIV